MNLQFQEQCARRSHKSYLLQFLRQGRKSSERYRQWLPQEKTQTWPILSCTRKAQRYDKRNKFSLIKKETTSQLRHLRSFFPSSFKQSLAANQTRILYYSRDSMGRIHRPTFAGPKHVTGNSDGLIFCLYDYARASMNTKYFLIRLEFVLLTMIAKIGGNSNGAAFRVR